MTAPTAAATGTARTARPGWLPPRWLVVAAVLVLAVVLTDAVTQAVVPFIRCDDWPLLLPPHTPFATDVYAKNLLEGRWLNWVWWVGIGQRVDETVRPLLLRLLLGLGVVLAVSGAQTVVT